MAQDEAGGGPQTIKVRRSRSLMAKLVVTFLVLSILMVGVVALLATQRARASLEESVYGRLEAAQVLTSQSVVRWIEEQRRNLTFTASLLGGVQQQNSPGAPTDVVAELLDSESAAEVKVVAREELRARLQSIVRQTADAAEIFVLDENGVIVASTTPAHEGLDQSDEEYVTRGVSGQYTRPVGRSDLSDDPAVIVSTPLFDSDGLLRGVLAANLDLSRLDRIVLQETGLGDGGQSYLVDSESEFVHARLSESTDEAVRSTGIDDALAQTTGRGQYLDYAGVPVVGAYAWVDDIGAALVSEIAQEQAFAPASELAATIAIIGVIVVLLMGVLIYIASRRIAGPVLSITETAVAVRGGDLSRMAPVRTHDEVGVLAETFNQMTGQLRENVETLERRVDERTAELATQKAYFEALVEISPAAVVTMDLDQHVTGWNPAATTLFGYRPEEAIGRSIDDLVLGSDEMRAEGAAVAQASLATGRHDLITRRSRRDGSIVDVEVVMVPLVVDGQTVGSYVVYHDITELQAARLEADRANEAKSAFLATMSHEIRTPMNAIIGMSGLLAETDLDDEQQEYAGIVQGSSEALLAIINDILDFSKIEAGRMDLESVEFSLRDCIESSLDLIGPLALRKGLDVAYQMPPEAPDRLVGDPNRVRQILINLLSNAVKFTETGHVRLSVAAEQPSRAGSDASISISVTDTGIGLTEEQVGRLFESFSQADISTARRYGGTGLGLAISRRLAELMGGELHVRSPGLDGHGSTFQLTIPAVVAAPPEAVPDFLLGRRVLVAEPSSINRGVLAVLLEGWGAEVLLTDDLARDDTPPSVDVVLIGCGTDTASDALARVLALRGKSTTPVVLSSAAPRRDVLTDPRWGGVAFLDWVSKPIKPAALAASMGRSLGIVAMPESDREADDRGIDEPAARPMAILLAEDNALNQKLAVTLLTRMGHVVTVADNGRSAVDLALGQPFDLILMDIQMPDMDGLEATRRIIDALGERRPRIVALTANALSEDRGATEAAGMDDYLAKPLRRDELARVLRDAASSQSRESAIPDRGAESAEDGHRHDDDAIDAAAFRAKVSEMVGAPDPEFERELISEFLDGLPALVASVETAGDTADADLLRRACHTLKSHAAIFGAARLEDQCRRLEALAGEGGTPQGLIAGVVTEAWRVEVLVRRLA